LIGGGIASLAAAALLIREAGVDGQNICIIEQSDKLGGSLDGSGTIEAGFSTRGGRMFEDNFACTFDLFASIPSSDDNARSVAADIREFNQEVVSFADCRLVRNGRKMDDRHRLGLSWSDRAAILLLAATSERRLEERTINSWFADTFFQSNFWLLWSTMFSFTPKHSLVEMRRYMMRFIHLFPGLSSLSGILRTRYNQYDSMIEPLQAWLVERGVKFRTGLAVTDIRIEGDLNTRRVSNVLFEDGEDIHVLERDRVYITLGSMTDASSLGSGDDAPTRTDEHGPSWKLWEKLAADNQGLGRPEAFCGNPEATAWNSFTVTLDHSHFHDFMEKFSSNSTGTGGLVTFADSGWLLSIVLAHQPHFRNQPPGSYTFWGYGLAGKNPGNVIPKSMWSANGDEILSELSWHLRLDDSQKAWFDTARIIPCRMPFITSQFMPRKLGDRPAVQPKGSKNFAVIGQFCEIERDCVFTVEYSVRSAWEAVKAMTKTCAPPPPVVRTDRDLGSLLRAARCLLRN
jgi:oleate hydratase